MHRNFRVLPLFILACFFLTGCSHFYYEGMEKFGRHKRDILVDRVIDARDEQEEAKEQFATALEQFKSVVAFEGGDLETKYDQLQDEYDRSEEKANALRERIDSVENVAEALFDEWEDELDDYQSGDLRRASERQLRDTRERYEDLLTAMRRVEERMEPVLEAFEDQVLFLKHNLNARAIASLQGTLVSIESDVDALIQEMNQSIEQANSFLREMELAPAE